MAQKHFNNEKKEKEEKEEKKIKSFQTGAWNISLTKKICQKFKGIVTHQAFIYTLK